MGQTRDNDVLPITAVRSRLFDLVEELLTGQRSIVELSHRSYDERVVLLRKRELDSLRADLAALRAQAGAEPRRLRGYATVHGDADEILARIRSEQAELGRTKLDAILGGGEA